MSDQTPTNQSTRRKFLKHSAAASAAFSTLAVPRNVHADEGDIIKVGLIGCGGRGTGAAIDALHADPQAKLVAMGDVFLDRAQTSLANLKANKDVGDRVVADEYVFSGFDAYKQVVDQVDVVILTSTPHFRPRHLAYAIEQNKK
jgi:predicted dehydrogenase